MNPLEQLMLAWQALRHTLPQLWRPGLWLWVLPLALVQLTVVALLWHAAHPAVSWFMAPLLVRLTGDDTLHYPRIFELMPTLYQRADVGLGAVLGAIGIGAATPAFAARFRGEPLGGRRALGDAFRRAPALVLVQLPFNVVLFLLSTFAGACENGKTLTHRSATQSNAERVCSRRRSDEELAWTRLGLRG